MAKKDYSLFGVGLSYSNAYEERTIIQRTKIGSLFMKSQVSNDPCYGTKTT